MNVNEVYWATGPDVMDQPRRVAHAVLAECPTRRLETVEDEFGAH